MRLSGRLTCVIVSGLLLTACAPAAIPTKVASGPIATAGARCTGGACACRRIDNFGQSMEGEGQAAASEEGAVAAGQKRFELRTGRGLDPVSVTVDGRGTFEKSTTSPEPSCAYLDLPPGKHHVRLHAVANSGEAGMEPALFIYEYSPERASWYSTFAFRCGGGDMECSQGHMQEWLEKVQKLPRGIFDPCGSVRVEGLRWEAGKSVGVKLADLDVDLTLEVYKFPPRFVHGTTTCKGPSSSAGSAGAPGE